MDVFRIMWQDLNNLCFYVFWINAAILIASELRSGVKSSENSQELQTKEVGETGESEEMRKPKKEKSEVRESAEEDGNVGEKQKSFMKVNDENKTRKKKRNREEKCMSARYGVVGEEGKAMGRKRKNMETEEDLVVGKDGFDLEDESKLLRTVFIRNSQAKIKKQVLIMEFGKFGKVEAVRIGSTPPLKDREVLQEERNFGYVVFETEESAQASLLPNMVVIEGIHIRVDRACPSRKKLEFDNNAPLYDSKQSATKCRLVSDTECKFRLEKRNTDVHNYGGRRKRKTNSSKCGAKKKSCWKMGGVKSQTEESEQKRHIRAKVDKPKQAGAAKRKR